MTVGLAAMLLGVFGVPALLLWAGHRLRKRAPRWRSAFWGGIVGHLTALLIGSVAGMVPAESWAASDSWRGALGFWSFLVLPLAGASIGALTTSTQRRLPR